jgi:hypothetical protein
MTPIDYTRSIWPKGITKPELQEVLHCRVSIRAMIKKRAIENTGVRRRGHVVYRYRPYQLRLPFGDE